MMKHFSWILILALMITACNTNTGSDKETAGGTDTISPSDYPEHGVRLVPIQRDSTGKTTSGESTQGETMETKEEVSDTDIEPASPGSKNTIVRVATPETESRMEARRYFNEGVSNNRKKKYTEGITAFDKVLELEPDNHKAYYQRGYAYYHLKSYGEAEQDFQKAISLFPTDTASMLYLGLILYNQGKYPAAIKAYNACLEVGQKFATAYYNRGIAKGQLQKYEEAEKDFSKALEIYPDYEEAYYNRGLAKFFQGDTIRACADWQSAKELGSSSASQAILYYCNRSDK